jgi:DNA-binding MarR family transcriptional regulator
LPIGNCHRAEAATKPGEAPDDESVERLRRAVLRLGRELRRTSAEEGLSPAQSSVLATLVRHGPMRAGELSAAEGLNPTMLSRVLAHLDERGLAVRAPDAADRRGTLVRATPAGRRLVRRLRARHGGLLLGRLQQLPEDQVRAILAALPALEGLSSIAPRGEAAPAAAPVARP